MLKRKVKGYALTLEVLFTILTMAFFFDATVYLMSCMNVDRYVSTILTSTLIEEAKLGGRNNNLTKLRLDGKDPITIANNQLQEALEPIYKNQYGYDHFNTWVRVSGGPATINNPAHDKVWVTVTWYYPPMINMLGYDNLENKTGIHGNDNWISPKTKSIKMNSIVRNGNLIDKTY